jgi:hypothetical protein
MGVSEKNTKATITIGVTAPSQAALTAKLNKPEVVAAAFAYIAALEKEFGTVNATVDNYSEVTFAP